jgi:RimJ/RimL family protein N-acetyltransferase
VDEVWAPAGIRIAGEAVELRPATEADVVALAAVLPDDYELDPSVGTGLPRPLHLLRTYWRDQGAWSAGSWKLHLLASTPDGRPVGEQILEAEDFGSTRTVDSASWVRTENRGYGIGRAMRSAMLALAFDGLGATRAVTSAWQDNAASLAVSRGLGYRIDHLERRPRGDSDDDLVHMELTSEAWRAAVRPSLTLSGVPDDLTTFGI